MQDIDGNYPVQFVKSKHEKIQGDNQEDDQGGFNGMIQDEETEIDRVTNNYIAENLRLRGPNFTRDHFLNAAGSDVLNRFNLENILTTTQDKSPQNVFFGKKNR